MTLLFHKPNEKKKVKINLIYSPIFIYIDNRYTYIYSPLVSSGILNTPTEFLEHMISFQRHMTEKQCLDF